MVRVRVMRLRRFWGSSNLKCTAITVVRAVMCASNKSAAVVTVALYWKTCNRHTLSKRLATVALYCAVSVVVRTMFAAVQAVL